MFGPKELDLRNIYNPDLKNIQESAERTYGEANSFYRKEELYLKDLRTISFWFSYNDDKKEIGFLIPKCRGGKRNIRIPVIFDKTKQRMEVK